MFHVDKHRFGCSAYISFVDLFFHLIQSSFDFINTLYCICKYTTIHCLKIQNILYSDRYFFLGLLISGQSIPLMLYIFFYLVKSSHD